MAKPQVGRVFLNLYFPPKKSLDINIKGRYVSGAIRKQNVPKSGKTPKGGGEESVPQNKKPTLQRCRLFEVRGEGGVWFLKFFSNANVNFKGLN